MNELEVFKEISMGGVTKEQLISQLLEKNIQFNKYAHMLFEHPSFSMKNESENVKLVKVKISELGITKPFFYQEIVNKASSIGLKLCPLYLGAFLRLSYLDQPEGPYLTIASVKPEEDENYPNGFYIRNFDNALWLRGYRATDDYEWPIDSEFIFLKIDGTEP
ncbi:MAG: hypothetical protein ACXVCD_09385 [Pseudobdellovibrionaceae bacterium]